MISQEEVESSRGVTHRQVVATRAASVFSSDLRLDAGHYTREVFIAQRNLIDSGFETAPITDLSDRIFMPGRGKRVLSDDPSRGKSFLMPSELFNFPLVATKYVLGEKLPNPQDWFVRNGWLLVTRSGVTGIPLLCTKRYEDYVISDDGIRIVTKPGVLAGFIYAYLSTWTGRTLLTRNDFGVAVDHIQPHQLETLRVPQLPPELGQLFHKFMVLANEIRDDAEDNLRSGMRLLHERLQLQILPEMRDRIAEVFSMRSGNLDLRLDASYHEPYAKRILAEVESKLPTQVRDGLGTVELPTRFKRTYVEKEFGIPFLQGGSIIQIRPLELKYVSRKMTKNLDSLIIHKNWVLITRSGTVGRVALVPPLWDGWAASEHVIRVIPNEAKINPGYLGAFLFSAYGNTQLTSKIHGGVVDEITVDDVENLKVPIPERAIQDEIGRLVIKAFILKEIARVIEDETAATLEAILEKKADKDVTKLSSSLEDTIRTVLSQDLVNQISEATDLSRRVSWESIKKAYGLDV